MVTFFIIRPANPDEYFSQFPQSLSDTISSLFFFSATVLRLPIPPPPPPPLPFLLTPPLAAGPAGLV